MLNDGEQGKVDAIHWGRKDKVMPTDILDLIEEKYSRLRHKLLTMMMKLFSGETTWEILSESECYELIEEVRVLFVEIWPRFLL